MTPMKEHKKLISVIIPAAGNAIRMNGVNKTFFALGGCLFCFDVSDCLSGSPWLGRSSLQ